MKTCVKCGAQLADDATFCGNCGSAQPAAAPQQAPYQAPQQAPQQAPYQAPQQAPYQAPQQAPYQAPYGQAPQQAPYQAPYQAPAPAAPTYLNTAGITERNIALAILFSVISCGIYGIYWMVKINDEVNQLANEPNATSGGLVVLLTIVTGGIYGWYWIYKMGERIDAIKGTPGSNNILYIVLQVCGLGIVNYCLIQDVINKTITGRPY